MTQTLPERLADGTLPAYAWPGGYPMFYLDREDSVLCAACASKSLNDPDEIPQFKPVAADIHYEGPSMWCDYCSAEIGKGELTMNTERQQTVNSHKSPAFEVVVEMLP